MLTGISGIVTDSFPNAIEKQISALSNNSVFINEIERFWESNEESRIQN